MRAEIRRIHRELGRSTIYVTHDQDEALSLADRIVVMKEGVVQQIGAPAEIYSRPANLHVARFMGYRNVLDMEVETSNGNAVSLASGPLRLTGTAMQALAGSAEHPLGGKRAWVAIRPEELVASSSGPNLIEGVIDNAEYCGRDSLIDVRTAAGAVLHARAPASSAAGEQVRLTVPAERVLVYPHE
jgi:putative spermidine/putrescine transport system ATP-binding protein